MKKTNLLFILSIIVIVAIGIYSADNRNKNNSNDSDIPPDETCNKASFVYQEENSSQLPIDSEEKAKIILIKVIDKFRFTNVDYKITKDNAPYYIASHSSSGVDFLIHSNGTIYKKLKCLD